MGEKETTIGRALSVGGPNKLLPDTPKNIVSSKNYNQSIPLMIGATKHDGTYYTGGLIFVDFFNQSYFIIIPFLQFFTIIWWPVVN